MTHEVNLGDVFQPSTSSPPRRSHLRNLGAPLTTDTANALDRFRLLMDTLQAKDFSPVSPMFQPMVSPLPRSDMPRPANASAGSHPLPSMTTEPRGPHPRRAQVRVMRTFSEWTPGVSKTTGPVPKTWSSSSSSSMWDFPAMRDSARRVERARSMASSVAGLARLTPSCTVGHRSLGTTAMGIPPRTTSSNHSRDAKRRHVPRQERHHSFKPPAITHVSAMRSTSSSGSSIDGDAPNPNPQSAAATNSEDLFRNENVENSRLLV